MDQARLLLKFIIQPKTKTLCEIERAELKGKILHLVSSKRSRWLKGNDIKTGSTTGSDYWAAYVGGVKIKTDGLKQQTRTDVIKYPLKTYLKPDPWSNFFDVFV